MICASCTYRATTKSPEIIIRELGKCRNHPGVRPTARLPPWRAGLKRESKPKAQGDENMKARQVLAIILITCWLGVLPAAARDCCHHEHDCAYGNDYKHDYDHEAQGSHHCYGWTPTAGAAEMRTAEGKITEIIYLPGA